MMFCGASKEPPKEGESKKEGEGAASKAGNFFPRDVERTLLMVR